MAKRIIKHRGMQYESVTDDERVVRLEANYETLARGQANLEAEVQEIGHKLDRGLSTLGDRFAESRKTPWAVIITALGVLLTFFAIIGTAGFTVTKMQIDAVSKDFILADLGRDKLVDSMFKEVEAQFKGVTTELNTQIANNSEVNSRQDFRLREIANNQRENEKQIHSNTQWREDFDKYVWPLVLNKLQK